MPNVMAALPNMSGALYKSSLISFLVPRRKVWLTPMHPPPKCIYNVAVQETAKYREKFG